MTSRNWLEKCAQESATDRLSNSLQLPTPEGAYRDIVARQAARDTAPLSDSRGPVERQANDYLRRQSLAYAFGDFIAYGLGKWDWFINPISFRDRHPDMERNPETGKPRNFRSTRAVAGVRFFAPDPRLKGWVPDYLGRMNPAPPVTDLALAEIKDFLSDVQEAAEQPIRSMIAEEFGGAHGRYHCHLLVGGVAHLRRDVYWRIAFERFGRTTILPFDPTRGAAFYCAKYAAKQLGGIHFGVLYWASLTQPC